MLKRSAVIPGMTESFFPYGERRAARPRRSAGPVIAIVAALIVLMAGGRAWARDLDLPMRAFSQRDGIDSSYIFGMAQDRQGYLYVLTKRSLYFFSGRRFYEVSIPPGPGETTHVDALRFLPDGRVLALRHGALLLSTEAPSARRSPLALSFRTLGSEGVGRIAEIYLDGSVVVATDSAGIHFCTIIPPARLLCQTDRHWVAGRGTRIFQMGDRVYFQRRGETVLRDRQNVAMLRLSRAVSIPDPPAGNVDRQFYAMAGRYLVAPVAGGGWTGLLLERAYDLTALDGYPTFVVATRDAAAFFDGSHLRSYNGRYWGYPNHALGREQEMYFAFVDRNRQFWTVQDAVELDKLTGWGIWENIEPQSIRSVWSVLPGRERQLLFTNQGLFPLHENEIGDRLKNGNFFFGLDDGRGGYWAPVDDRNLLHCLAQDEQILCDRKLSVGRVLDLARAPYGDRLWIASDDGLMEFDVSGANTPAIVEDDQGKPLARPVSTLALRDGITPWAVIGDALYRRQENGHWARVLDRWPNGSKFSPTAMVFSSHNDLWVGGVRASVGLVHITLGETGIRRIDPVDPAFTGSQIIFSLLFDRDHHLWVGTENGLAVSDGHAWIRLTKDDGLVSANINQKGLAQDPDGSIWITTTRGVAHLLHPEHFFEKADLDPVFIQVKLGDSLLPERAVSFTRDPLTVTLGTLNTDLAPATYFRYRLEGVDQDWVRTTTGEIRYNFVPPGHTRLVVQAINDNRNLESKPVVLEIRMKRPWWMAWPLIVFYVVAVVTCPYIFNRMRFRYLLKRQKRLESLVLERTVEMRAAQNALEQQARQDGLTRLMNRRTVEASVLRVLDGLARPDHDEEQETLTIALFDVDYFKSINDTFGHTIGDEILTEIGTRFLRDKKPDELIGRYGGEEFLIIVPGAFASACARIRVLLSALTAVPFETKVGALTVGCSAGIARTIPGRAPAQEIWIEALERADQALYQAKLEGRGRLVVSERDRDDEDCRD